MIENRQSKFKQKQTLMFTVVGIVLFSYIFLIVSDSGSSADKLADIMNNSKDKIILQDPGQGLKAEDRWLENAEEKLSDYEDFKKNYDADRGNIDDRFEEIEQRYNDTIESQNELINRQNGELNDLKNLIQSKKSQSNKKEYFNENPASGGGGATSEVPLIQSIDIELQDSSENNALLRNAKDYVPAGAYAKARIISGVDASVGISAQSDPRPVLLRVKSEAKSSIYDGDYQSADINGCIITGAASGDLSSEKVYIKLIKMTCGDVKNKVKEVDIKGYVAGQGKSGVRGNVISREGDLLVKSFFAGLVGGVGQGISQKVAPPLNFSNGLTTQGAMSSADVARKGVGQGVASSSDRLATYLIDRAEQYQPVVSIPSGIDVEVVFLKGFFINKINSNQEKDSQ